MRRTLRRVRTVVVLCAAAALATTGLIVTSGSAQAAVTDLTGDGLIWWGED
jgi:hypothetical protein